MSSSPGSMWRFASMNTRPWSSSCVMQLGAHEWLIQRAALPRTRASITRPSSISNRNVCAGSSGSLSGRSIASSHVERLPLYSMMRSSRAISRVANTPRPWMPELRTA